VIHDVRKRKKSGAPRRARIDQDQEIVVRKAKTASVARIVERRTRTESAVAADILVHHDPRRNIEIEAIYMMNMAVYLSIWYI
jgi:hypothetical protein